MVILSAGLWADPARTMGARDREEKGSADEQSFVRSGREVRPLAERHSETRPLALRVTEARGTGQPIWRRWVDLDRDGRSDLVVVSASSSAAPPAGSEDRVEKLVAWLHVTPEFLDRRQVLLFRQTAEGLVPWGSPLPLTGDTAAVDVADVTGDGAPEILYAAGFRVYAFARASDPGPFRTEPVALIEAPLLVGHSRSFVPGARLAADLTGTVASDLLLATPAGLEIRSPKEGGGYAAVPSALYRNPLKTVRFAEEVAVVSEPAPWILDADGDGTVDLLFSKAGKLALLHGIGGGRFEGTARRARLPGETATGGRDEGWAEEEGPGSEREGGGGVNLLLASLGTDLIDIDGDGLLDYLGQEEVGGPEPDRRQGADGDATSAGLAGAGAGEREDGDTPQETRVRIYRGRPGFVFQETPDITLALSARKKIEGTLVKAQRIDGDARADLLVTRVSTGLFQLARLLVTKKLTLTAAFETMLQRQDGSFAPSRGSPFETRITIDLKRGIESTPTTLRGDFDGDGITDLIEFTSRPAALVHLTTRDGEIPAKAALSVPLPRGPEDGALVDIEDIDGDGRSDVAFFTPDGEGFTVTSLRSGP